jgi:large subunit ribosomal protein L9
MDIILLEKINKLGSMGDVVNVRDGYARNFLLPQKKALRATKDNMAYFEKQKSALEKVNAEKRSAAEKEAKKIEGAVLPLIRQASESGQLYGSVAARDIADLLNESFDVKIERSMIDLNQNFKTLGLFSVVVMLHPEVAADITLNIARSMEEADVQKKTGKALIASEVEEEERKAEKAESEAKAQEAAEAAEAQAEAEAEENAA